MLNKLKRAALGAHTPHDKATAASKPIPMPLPAQVRILMSQHIGAPAKALVKKGDEVFVGTKIGEAGGFVSANIHSSVSGTVAAVEPFRLSNGRMCDSVVIKTDGKQTVDPAVKAPEVTDKASFLAAVRECGLVGLGGAGFPTDVKLQPKQSVDTLLINASECEVWLTSDTQEMLECSDDIIRGIKAVLQYTGIPKCIIGIENNKPECIDLLCKKTKDDSAIEVKPLPSVYGTGAELILIEKCLGREVPHGGLPADAGAIVMRHPQEGAARLATEFSGGVPILNAGDGANQHPTQTLLDLFTIQETQGRLENLNVAMVGDLKYGRTVHSLTQALAKFNGNRFYFIAPDALAMPQYILDMLDEKGIAWSLHSAIDEVMAEVDILYMTRVQKERLDPSEYANVKAQFVLRAADLEGARVNMKVLHPLPRVDEITTDVDKTPHAWYFQQAGNGIFARQALLALVLNSELAQ